MLKIQKSSIFLKKTLVSLKNTEDMAPLAGVEPPLPFISFGSGLSSLGPHSPTCANSPFVLPAQPP